MNQNLDTRMLVSYKIGDAEVKLTPKIVQEYILNGSGTITNQEFKMFSELCKIRKLNPFLKEAYLIKYSDKTPATIVVGKDAILKRAILNPTFDGREQGVIILTENGEVIERSGSFKLPTDILVGGWAKVYRKDWSHPIYITVSFDEVAQRKSDGNLNQNWSSKGATMVEKVALVRALREAFVEDLSGMIDEDEAFLNTEARQSQVKQIKQHDVFDSPVDEAEETEILDIESI